MCPTQNNTSGSLKYPDIDKDKTEVLRKQVEDGLVENVKDTFTFNFSFTRTEPEIRSAEKQESEEHRLVDAKNRVSLDVAEVTRGDYHVTVKMTVRQALDLLKSYGVTLDFQVHRTYVVKTEQGEEVVNFPKRPTAEHSQTPRAGIESNMTPAKCPKINHVRPPAPHIPTQTARVVVSHEFDILVGYFPACYANREDFFEVRLGIWHEIMELAILALTMEALYWPLDLYHSRYINDIPNSFANAAVAYVQQWMYGSEGRKKFLYWEGDPPFDYFEVSGYTREADARRLEDDAVSLERQGNWAGAREKWIEAEDAWEKAIRAWQAVPQHSSGLYCIRHV